MDVICSMPVVKGEVGFTYAGAEIRMTVDLYDENFRISETVEFSRVNKRWRWVGGPFVSVHTIAAKIFKYDDNPPVDQRDWMGGYVSDMGKLIDVAQSVIEDGSRKRIDARNATLELLWRKQEESKFFASDTEQAESQDFIYLMRHRNGLVKIGRSRNPVAREKTLQAEDPRLEMFFYGNGDKHIERRLHRIFHELRVRGEWFKLERRHVDWITFLIKPVLESE
jgi:hypothetical protein